MATVRFGMSPKIRIGKPWWRHWEFALIAISVTVAVGFASIMVIITARRPLSPLEATLFQIVVLGIGLGGGLIGSYKFGQSVAANRQYARSALRSALVLYKGILGLHEAIELLKTGDYDKRLDLLQSQVDNQANVAQSVIADWSDVIPEDSDDVGEMLDFPEARDRSQYSGDSN